MSADDDDDAAADFRRLLDVAAERSRRIPFWWRDDDAETATPALDRLLELGQRFRLPLGLAVVPKGADAALADRLAGNDRVAVLQHGWRHQAHNPEGQKSMELGDHRPLGDVLDELRWGFDRLDALFGAQFLPVLAPPWNRIGDAVRSARAGVGLVGLSTFGRVSAVDPHWVNTHLDTVAWREGRRPLPRAKVYATLSRELQDRLDGSFEPIGILTHHLVHQADSWTILEELFDLLARHPAVRWPRLPELFALDRR